MSKYVSKIGILTFYYKNYNMGGQLQAYALQKALTNMGYDAEQICYDYSNVQTGTYTENIKHKLKKIMHDNGLIKGSIACINLIIQKGINIIFRNSIRPEIESRKRSYENFALGIPHTQLVYNSENIGDTVNNYDIFICGGDQIWNDWGNKYDKDYPKVFSLQFVPDNKIKFSYAASTGQADLSEDFLKKLAPGIKKMDTISVRERSSVESIKKITEKDVATVVDPVLLLNEEIWSDVVFKKGYNDIKEPFAFCYILGPDSRIKRRTQKWCHKLGLKVLSFPYIQNRFNITDMFWGDIHKYDAGPEEFVNIIQNAQLVLTDSYHAMVFAMIFHKPFYVFERSSIVGGATMSTRITDFLDEYGLRDRLITIEELNNMKKFDLIDYNYADNVLKSSRDKSVSFLEKSLRSPDDSGRLCL